MKHSETLGELFKALSKAQGEIKPAIKDATNPHLKSKYADLGSVWEACREALAANGLSVSQWPVTTEGAAGITLMTVLGHVSGEYMMAAYTMPAAKADAQSYGSALTYSKRYALSAVLGIVADDDDDGHAASRAPARQQAIAAPPAPVSQPDRPAEPDRSKDHLPIGKQAARLEAELTEKGVTNVMTFARKVCNWAELDDLSQLTVKQARQLLHAAGNVRKGEAA